MIGRRWLASQEAASTCGLSEISLFVSLRNYRGHARRFASPPLSLMIGKNLRRRTNRVNQADVRGNAYRVLLFYMYVPGNRLAFEPGQKVGPWKAQRLLTARQVNVCVITKETDVPSVSGWMSPSMQSEEPRSHRTDLFNSHSLHLFRKDLLFYFVFFTAVRHAQMNPNVTWLRRDGDHSSERHSGHHCFASAKICHCALT